MIFLKKLEKVTDLNPRHRDRLDQNRNTPARALAIPMSHA
jgi:hypothetical protein